MMPTTIRTAGTDDVPHDDASRRAGRARALVLAPLALLLWIAAGWGSVGVLDGFRTMTVLPIGQWDADAPLLGVGACFAGVFLGSLTGFALVRAGLASVGAMAAPFLLTNANALLGVALGQVAASGEWAPVPVPGQTIEQGVTTAWGPVEWIAYDAPVLLPAAMLGLAALQLVPGLVSLARARGRTRTADALRVHGRRARGTISTVDFTSTWIMGMPQFRVVVDYDTLAGPMRVETRMTTDPMRAPMPGGPVDVLYDPRAPQDPRRTTLSLPADAPAHPAAAMFLPPSD